MKNCLLKLGEASRFQIIEKLVVEGSKWAIHTIPKKWHSDDSVNADAEVPIEDLESKQLMPNKDKNR
ncbi:unnamed protein product [Bursaphelenchus xylophilus]|uniref:(pine wood nematode) hypothetical protein n=1 Tax=Bursaphelenchus xylophilus TaxID=6326 RepID=A0A7I8WGH7_BURXY|nr:unnamed protein product [Bursaphelenchus xylophilus]CAG9111133.1 unnamed protein product [Bursaphelenchus xylophilus]